MMTAKSAYLRTKANLLKRLKVNIKDYAKTPWDKSRYNIDEDVVCLNTLFKDFGDNDIDLVPNLMKSLVVLYKEAKLHNIKYTKQMATRACDLINTARILSTPIDIQQMVYNS